MVKQKTFSVCVSCRCWAALFFIMMTSSNGNIFHVTGPLCGGIHRWLVNSPHKGQWRGALVFPLICGWANNCAAGDLRRHCVDYAVSVMRWLCRQCNDSSEIATQNFIISRWKYNLIIIIIIIIIIMLHLYSANFKNGEKSPCSKALLNRKHLKRVTNNILIQYKSQWIEGYATLNR